MPVVFRSKSGKDPVKAITDLIRDVLPSRAAMQKAAEAQIARIRARTLAGQDVNGNEFAPYSPKYAKLRQKAGKSGAPPNLQFTNRLLGSLDVQVRSEKQFAIVITDEEAREYGAANNYGTSRGLPARRWFDTSDAELGQMMQDLRKDK